MARTFRGFLESISPSWLLGDLSGAFVGVVFSQVADTLAEGMSLAVRMGWLLDPDSPPDVLPMIGQERGMQRYPIEADVQHRARLHGAWEAYLQAGTVHAIVSQFAAAGYEVRVQRLPDRPGPDGGPWWSQFWVIFPPGTHPITGVGPTWGSFSWGDGTLYGPGGMTAEFAALIRGIVRDWKSSRWICRGFIFELGDALWGGFDWGDGTVYGGYAEIGF
jgi:hypothetical protein